MPTLCSCQVIGHLYEQPKQVGTGDRTGASFRFYTTDRVKGADGQYAKEFTSHSGIVWGKEAEWLIRDGVKGSLVGVSGTFRVRKWESAGKAGAGTDIQCQSARILDRKEEDGNEHQPAQSDTAARGPIRPAPSAVASEDSPPFMREDMRGLA